MSSVVLILILSLYNNNIFFYVYIMIYTYRGKGGETHKGIVPMNNRPFTNETPVNVQSSFGKQNPIKHWRKQLFPYYDTTSDLVTINMLETPSAINLTDLTDCTQFFEQVPSLTTCDGVKNENNSCTGGTNHITRSGSTLYNKNYCSSTRQYLQKRCKTYEQNMLVGKALDLDKYLFNSTSNVGSDPKYNCVTYKQSNPSFNMIGSAVASNFISKKKNNAIKQNPYNPQKKLESNLIQCCVK
jgi:hypothetical protein